MSPSKGSNKKSRSLWRLIEDSPGIKEGFKELPEHLNPKTITTGIVAAVFGCTGPALIIMDAAEYGGLTRPETVSWLFAIYFFGGMISIISAAKYKQPVTGAWSIPGAVLMMGALQNLTINQAVGGYFLAGVLVLVLGMSGLVGKVMRWLPLPIVMGMIAGALIDFGTDIILSSMEAPLIGGSALFGYLVLPKITRKVPAVLGALGLGIVMAVLMGQMEFAGVDYGYVAPQVITPSFSFEAFLSVSLPLAILVIGAENAQAVGVMMAKGYRPPINFISIASGLGGIIASFFGGHNANIAGPMTAINASEEAGDNLDARYAAAVVCGVVFALFGIFASVAVAFVGSLPGELISIVAGLAMVGVLLSAFEDAFSKAMPFRVGAFFAMVIAMSGITILEISAPFWALIGGVIVSYLVEPGDYKKQREENEREENELKR